MNNLKLALLQISLVWEQPDENFDKIIRLVHQTESADLLILPEMFPTGFTMKPHNLPSDLGSRTLSFLKSLSREVGAAVCGSAPVSEQGKFYNRLYFVTPQGNHAHYDKRHLFSLAGEEKVYSAGQERILIEYAGWKILPLVCYDLRFPVWSRNTTDFDLLLYVANWPQKRIAAWDALLRARAVENMCYTAGVNRVGDDLKGFAHNGHSMVYDVLGQPMANLAETEGVFTYTLSREEIKKHRSHLGFLNDRDIFDFPAKEQIIKL